MKRGMMHIALEDLDMVPEEPVEIESPGFAKSLQAVFEAEEDHDKVCMEIDEIDKTMDEIDTSVEHLVILRDVIAKYGISGPIMIAADPHRELVNIGICPAYEELNDVPVDDVNAAVTIEGINNVLVSITNRVASVAKDVGELMATLSIETKRLTGSYEQALSVAEKRLNGASFDEDRFKEMSIRGVNKADFNRLIKICDRLISLVNTGNLEKIITEFGGYLRSGSLNLKNIKSVEKQIATALKPLSGNVELKELVGITVDVNDNDAVSISSSKPTKEERNLAAHLGWKPADAKMAIVEARKIVISYKNMAKHIDGISKLCKQSADILKGQIKKLEGLSPEESAGYKEAVSGMQRAVTINRKLMSASSKIPKIVSGAALQVAGAAIKTIK